MAIRAQAQAYLNAAVLEAKDCTGLWLRAQQRYLTLLPVNFYKIPQDYMKYTNQRLVRFLSMSFMNMVFCILKLQNTK